MPGAGVNINNIIPLITETKAEEFHFSGKKKYPSRMKYFNRNINMGNSAEVDEYAIFVSDYDIIHDLITKVKAFLSDKS
jgi:copper homeostasis protein CutC